MFKYKTVFEIKLNTKTRPLSSLKLLITFCEDGTRHDTYVFQYDQIRLDVVEEEREEDTFVYGNVLNRTWTYLILER